MGDRRADARGGSMRIGELFVPKAAMSYADALVSVGVADLVAELAPDAEVTVRDTGAAYAIAVSPPLETDQVRHASVSPGYPYVMWKRGDPVAGPGAFDYEAERQLEELARGAARAAKSARAQRLATGQGIGDNLAVSLDLQVYKIYNSMRTGSETYNQLHVKLRTPALPALVADRLEGLARGPATTAPSPQEAELAKAATNLQFWNPIGGKGVSRAKPDGTAVGQLSDKLVDWFSEWMKFRALRKALLAYRVGDDYKILVLAPGEMPIRFFHELRHDLLKQRLWGSIKLDIEAALALAQLLVERSPAVALRPSHLIFKSRPSRAVRGFATGYFKSLGSATATMNVSFLGLPGWFPAETREQVASWLEVLPEYRARLYGLREDKSDHVGTLLAYRNFVSGGRLDDALAFFSQYASLLLQQGEHLYPFRADNLRRVVMTYADESRSLERIIEDDGFKDIARAIRACTVRAQNHKGQLDRKARNDPLRVDIRYGLAQDWKRVVERQDEFVEKLSDFVASFNAEAARRQEKGEPSEMLISAEHLTSVVRLIEATKKPALVGRLLIAFGYASDWKKAAGGGVAEPAGNGEAKTEQERDPVA